MGFYATTEVRDENRYYPVFRSDKSENRLIKTESLSSVPDEFKVCVENEYDYMGRRFRKTVKDDYSGGSFTTTNVTTFIYNGWELIAEMCDAGYTNYYCYGIDASGSLGGAAGCGGLLSKTTVTGSDTNTYFYFHDGNANVVGMVDEAGSVVASYEYSPFGICIKATGSQASSNAFRYSGHYFDIETGIYNGKRRYYSPTLGRYLSRDPIEEVGGDNLYTYTLNDPVNMIDPYGEVPIWVERLFKEAGYRFWRNLVVRSPHWTALMDQWYYETGSRVVYINGISDPRNSDISTNPGFVKLLRCWIAMQRGETVNYNGCRSRVSAGGFYWTYEYSASGAGGLAAFRPETQFLGSYSATVSDLGAASSAGMCRYKIHIENTSGWTSATRLPGFADRVLRPIERLTYWSGGSLFYNHTRGRARYSPSRGGNFYQRYDFVTEEDCCATCVLP